eukprot:scaffold119897_cov66-Phaeocystis_antarctica.AAC.2
MVRAAGAGAGQVAPDQRADGQAALPGRKEHTQAPCGEQRHQGGCVEEGDAGRGGSGGGEGGRRRVAMHRRGCAGFPS